MFGFGLGLGIFSGGGGSLPPLIASISPATGTTGAVTPATITNDGSGAYSGSETVTIGGVSCTVTGHTSGTLAISVPASVPRGIQPVVVTNAHGSTTMPASASSGFFQMAMSGHVDPNSGVTQSGGLISALTDKAGTTSVFTSGWVAPTGARPTINPTEFAGGTRAGIDFFVGGVQSGLDGGAKLPFGSGAGATKGSVLWIGKWTTGSQAYGPLATNESNDWNLVNDISSGAVHWSVSTFGVGPAISPSALNDGVLRSYMGVYDATLGSANAKLIVNGSTVGTGNTTATFGNNGAHVCIGAYFSTGGALEAGNSLAGSLAECIFEAAAWSSNEIAFLTNKTMVGSPAYLAGVP